MSGLPVVPGEAPAEGPHPLGAPRPEAVPLPVAGLPLHHRLALKRCQSSQESPQEQLPRGVHRVPRGGVRRRLLHSSFWFYPSVHICSNVISSLYTSCMTPFLLLSSSFTSLFYITFSLYHLPYLPTTMYTEPFNTQNNCLFFPATSSQRPGSRARSRFFPSFFGFIECFSP